MTAPTLQRTSVRFRAYRDALAAAAADAARAIPTRPSIPVLNCVRITATDDGKIEIVGFDFDVCIRATLTADILEPGEVLVSGRTLAAMLAGMPDGTIDVALDGTRLALTMPRVRAGLRTVATDDYPDLPTPPPLVGTLPAADLARVLAKVTPAARLVPGLDFSGTVQLTAAAGRLSVAGTDRFTVALAGVGWDGPPNPVTVEASARALVDAVKAMPGDVSVCIDGTGIGLLGTERAFTSRRLAVEFPPCQAIASRIPEPTTRILLSADELADAMARAARVVTEDRRPVRLAAHPDGGLSYDADGGGDSDVAGDLDVEEVTGEPVVLGVNPQYMADALKPLGSSLVEIGIRGPRKALTVTSPDAPGDVHIIQPIFLP